MNILITGVAGLLGSNLADWITDNHPGHAIIGIDDLSGGYLDNINSSVIFYKEDLINDNLNYIFKNHKIDLIFHFAAYAAEGLSPFMRSYNYKNNLISTTKLINMAIEYDIKRFVFTSSMATYGRGKAPFDEKDIPMPIDPYGIAKYACEMDLRVAREQHGLDYCIVRPHNVYGKKQNIWDKYRNVLGIWMNQHLNSQPITLFGDGTQKRAFSYIGNCMEPLWNAGVKPEASQQIINLGGMDNITINDAAEKLLNIMGSGEKIYLENRYEVHEAFSTWQKSMDILGYNENISFEDGLLEMWEWAKIQPKRNQKVWSSYELTKGLYSYWEV